MSEAFVPLTDFVNESKSIPRDHPLDKPVAKWTEEEVLNGEIVEAGVVILRTRGCYWSIKEGCSMCGYFNDTVPGGVSDDMLREQWKSVRSILKGKKYAKIYTSGSFIDPTEVPFDFANEVMSDLSDMGVEKVLIESLPEFVNPKNFNYDKAPKLEIAIGLESSNPVVLDKSVNKRLRWPHFVKVCKLARDNGAEVKAYILLKPPYLSEKESIEDAVKSAIDAAPHVDKISINPVNVQKNTVVEKLWFRNEWVAPWLWSVVEVLKKCEDLPVRVYSDPTGGGTRRGAHNCHDCNKKILQALNNHRLGLGDLKGLHCNCKSRWDVLVRQSNLRRNGSEPHGYRSGFSGSRHF